MHGGVSDGIPKSGNAAVPGIRSKWNAKEVGPDRDPKMELLRKRGYGFGNMSFVDKERANGINTEKSLMRDNRPDIIY
jgi:hypothetical protein